MREIQNFEPGISFLSLGMNTLARSFTRESQRHGKDEFSLCPGPWNNFPTSSTDDCKGSPAPARLGEANEFLPQECRGTGPLEGERHEAEDADIVN